MTLPKKTGSVTRWAPRCVTLEESPIGSFVNWPVQKWAARICRPEGFVPRSVITGMAVAAVTRASRGRSLCVVGRCGMVPDVTNFVVPESQGFEGRSVRGTAPMANPKVLEKLRPSTSARSDGTSPVLEVNSFAGLIVYKGPSNVDVGSQIGFRIPKNTSCHGLFVSGAAVAANGADAPASAPGSPAKGSPAPHRGSGAIWFKITPVRVRCPNGSRLPVVSR